MATTHSSLNHNISQPKAPKQPGFSFLISHFLFLIPFPQLPSFSIFHFPFSIPFSPRSLFLFSIFHFPFSIALAQTPKPEINEFLDGNRRAFSFGAFGGFGMPGGDLQKGFGNHGQAGVHISYLFGHNWSLATEVSFLFGSDIKNDPIPTLRGADGTILGFDGTTASVKFDERAYTAPSLLVGKIFKLGHKRYNYSWEHGLRLQLGGAWFFHKVLIQDISKSVPLLNTENRKGFDGLRAGPGFMGTFGYLASAPSGRYSVYAEVVTLNSSTQSLRSYDYNTGLKDTRRYYDSYLLFRIGLSLNFYKLKEDEYFYY